MGVGPPPDPRYMLALRARHVCPPVLTYFDLGRPWLGPLPLRHVRSARCPSRSRHFSFPLSRLFHFIPTHLRHSIQIPHSCSGLRVSLLLLSTLPYQCRTADIQRHCS